MSASKKMGPTEMMAEVERLKSAGKLPSVERLLEVINETRDEYREKILAARREQRKL